jgi:hypothetical protein
MNPPNPAAEDFKKSLLPIPFEPTRKPSILFMALAEISDRQTSALKRKIPCSVQEKGESLHSFFCHFMKSGSPGGGPQTGHGTIYHSPPFLSRIYFGVDSPGIPGQEF